MAFVTTAEVCEQLIRSGETDILRSCCHCQSVRRQWLDPSVPREEKETGEYLWREPTMCNTRRQPRGSSSL
ncbi:unnamed protein product [Brassica oleracea]